MNAREHDIQDDADSKEISPRFHGRLGASGIQGFGGTVGNGSQKALIFGGQIHVGCLSTAKINDFNDCRAARFGRKHDIFGFQVSVDNAESV